MADLTAEFSPPNSAKRFTFTASSNIALTTAVTQFRFDLPTKYAFKQLRLRQMNQIAVKQDPKLTASEVMAALKEIQQDKLISYNLTDHYDCLYLAKTALSKSRLKNAFHDIGYTEIKLSESYLYLLDEPLARTTKTASTSAVKTTVTPLNQVQDFKELQKRALKLAQSYHDLQAGSQSYQNIMRHALEDNELLTKQKEQLLATKKDQEKQQQQIQRFLSLYFGRYLIDDQHKVQFLLNLLTNLNQPQVQKIIRGQTSNLWQLVKAVCDYDSTLKT